MKWIKYLVGINLFAVVVLIGMVSAVKLPTPPNPVLITNVNPTIKPTSTPKSAPPSNPTPPPTPDTRCLVWIDGQGYDVTQFRLIHGGGDIFSCGKDMSAVFHSQHSDSYLQQLVRYKLP